MCNKTSEAIKIFLVILPAILTLVCNLIFYLWFKSKVDNSIEKHKISYSGIFKEKIEIHRELLKKIFEIKLEIQQYQYFGNNESAEKIMQNINSFINFYLINQPFLSQKMLAELMKIRTEFQTIFDDFHIHNSTSGSKGIDANTKTEIFKKYVDAGNKLKTNNPFKNIEETIISEMRTELRIDNFK